MQKIYGFSDFIGNCPLYHLMVAKNKLNSTENGEVSYNLKSVNEKAVFIVINNGENA